MIIDVVGNQIEVPDNATDADIARIIKKNALNIRPVVAPVKERSWSDVPVDAIKNAPGSAMNLLGGIAHAVMHPIDTVAGATDIAAGGLRKVLPDSVVKALDSLNTPSMQADAEKADRVASAVGQFYKNRYGGFDKVRDTLATDPIGAAADATMLFQGGAGLARQAAKVPALADKAGAVANVLDAAGSAVNPITPVVNLGRAGYGRAAQYVKTNPGNLLADAIGATPEEAKAIAAAAMAAPQSIVQGSDLTLAQALAHQGVQNPNVALLEKIAAGGPGGNKLLQRYSDQAAARLEALKANGAETYMGAPADLSNNVGNKVGSILRTQAADDAQAARAAWEAVHGKALVDGVTLNLPLEDMRAAMAPLGRGTVGAGSTAKGLLSEAENIGTMELPAVAPLKQGKVVNSQSLEQAVRSYGGLSGDAGEIRDLGIKQSGTTGLVNNKSGKPVDLVAEEMHRRGFLPDSDPATLLDALRNGGGRKIYANDAVDNNALQRQLEASMGDAPAAERIAVPVPFDEFQRLRRSAGELGAKVAEKGSPTEAAVLNKFQGLLTETADKAASADGGLLGSNMSPEFLQQYNAARELTKRNAEMYKSGNNISQILRKPAGQNYTLAGDEITSKLWHGGQGLVGDIQNLKNTLTQNNYEFSLDALRKYVMTDATSKTTASGNLGAALPKYVEGRLPGLQELMLPDQLNSLTSVAKDIRNAEMAANTGVRGSDTQAKITRALDAGLLDSPMAKTIAKVTSMKGIGGETVRSKLAQMVIENKGKVVAELLADPKAAAAALKDADFVSQLDKPTLKRLSVTARLAPLAAGEITQSQR